MRWEVPRRRLMLQPMRSKAASACRDFVAGQFRGEFLGGNEGHVHRARNGLPVFEPICYKPKG